MVRIRTFLAIMLLLLTVLIAGCAENENAATVTSKDPVQKEQQQTLQGAQKSIVYKWYESREDDLYCV